MLVEIALMQIMFNELREELLYKVRYLFSLWPVLGEI
jgi:hypothetical protein